MPASGNGGSAPAGSRERCTASRSRSPTCSSTPPPTSSPPSSSASGSANGVDDPDRRRGADPRTFPFATKRVCLDTGYFETFNRPNVTLVDLRSTPIVEVTPAGLRTTERSPRRRRHRVRHRVRRHDRAAARHRPGRPRRRVAAARSGPTGRATYLGLAIAGIPEPVPDRRPGQPVGAQQHDRVDRAARRLDRRLRGADGRRVARP